MVEEAPDERVWSMDKKWARRRRGQDEVKVTDVVALCSYLFLFSD